MAEQLIESLAGRLRAREVPRHLPRGRARAHRAQGRRRGRSSAPAAAAEPDKVVDLMAALEASVAAAKQARKRHPTGREGGTDDEARRRPTTSKTALTRSRRVHGGVSPTSGTTVEIDGRQLSVTNLDKVLYPEVGFTKGEVIDYYVRIAPVMLTHLADRCVTFQRFPNGVDEQVVLREAVPGPSPRVGATAVGPGDRAAQGRAGPPRTAASTTACSTTWRRWRGRPTSPRSSCTRRWPAPTTSSTPTMVVFDLDPGAPAGDDRVRRGRARPP